MEIIWKYIPGFEDYYQASNTGLIRSVERDVWYSDGIVRHRKSVVLKQRTDKYGYSRVLLCMYNIHHYYCVHTLVAMSFLGKIPDKMTVNHIDGNKGNNNVSNLEIVSMLENRRHAIRKGLWNQRGEHSVKSKFSKEQVLEIRKRYSLGNTSYPKLAKEYGVGTSTIARIVSEKCYVY